MHSYHSKWHTSGAHHIKPQYASASLERTAHVTLRSIHYYYYYAYYKNYFLHYTPSPPFARQRLDLRNFRKVGHVQPNPLVRYNCLSDRFASGQIGQKKQHLWRLDTRRKPRDTTYIRQDAVCSKRHLAFHSFPIATVVFHRPEE